MEAKLGAGTHGSVYAVDDEHVVKRTRVVDRRSYGTYLADGLVNELCALERISKSPCRHIVHIDRWDCVGDGSEAFSELAMERLSPLNKLDPEQLATSAKVYIRQLFEALADLHHEDIAHCDLKLDNIMWRWRDDEIVLIDFGLAKMDSDVKPPEKARFTFDYRSPEAYLRAPKIDLKKADVWSAGVCAASIMSGSGKRSVYWERMYDLGWMSSLDLILTSLGAAIPCTFSALRHYKLFLVQNSHRHAHLQKGFLLNRISKRVSPEAADFIRQVLNPDPASRLSASEALKHRYLASTETWAAIPVEPRIYADRPIDVQSIHEIVVTCLRMNLCPETAFKAFDVLMLFSLAPGDEAKDPRITAAAVVLASCIGENKLINVIEVFDIMANWVPTEDIAVFICRVLSMPGVVSMLARPSVLRLAQILDPEIRGLKADPVVRKLIDCYLKTGGQRPTKNDIIESVF